MATPSKIFKVITSHGLEELTSKIRGLHYHERGTSMRVTQIKRMREGVEGSLEVMKELVPPIHVDFQLLKTPKGLFSVLICDRRLADRIANAFSMIRGIELEEIAVPMKKLRTIYTKGRVLLLLINGLGIRGISKILLYGDSVNQTELYSKYLKLGEEVYVVFKDEGGQVIGITRKGVVTFFTYIDRKGLVDFIKEKILPLV